MVWRLAGCPCDDSSAAAALEEAMGGWMEIQLTDRTRGLFRERIAMKHHEFCLFLPSLMIQGTLLLFSHLPS